METPPKFTLLLYDRSWGLSIFGPSECDPLYRATTDWSLVSHADAVLFHVPTAPRLSNVPKRSGQLWVAYCMESELNYPRLRDTDYMSRFDFRMTYRWDSDVPLMYWDSGMRRPLLEAPPPKTAAAPASFFASNPQTLSGRTEFVGELMRYLPVDCYGHVLRNRELAGDEGPPSKLATIGRYRFDLAFENSIARDYVTEKFYQPLIAGTVPVYRGAPNIEEFAPGDGCYINSAGFASPRELADYLLYLAGNPEAYNAYFEWKKRPLRQSFLKKIECAETDPLHRLCAVMRARGYLPGGGRGRWKSLVWPWRRPAGVC